MVADMFAAGTGNDHPAALNRTVIVGRLQANRHFRPQIERYRAAEFDTAFVDNQGIRGEFKTGLPRFDSNLLLKRINVSKFSSTHKATVKLTRMLQTSN